MRLYSKRVATLLGAVIATIYLAACNRPGDTPTTACCQFKGPRAYDCAAIEKLGSGADLDGRCNQVNQGESCSWNYGDATCCKIAIDDGFPGNVHCP